MCEKSVGKSSWDVFTKYFTSKCFNGVCSVGTLDVGASVCAFQHFSSEFHYKLLWSLFFTVKKGLSIPPLPPNNDPSC